MNILKEYIQRVLEATTRPGRLFYGANVDKSGAYFQQVLDGMLANSSAIKKDLSKEDFVEFKKVMMDPRAAKVFIAKKFANRFIAKNIKETAKNITLDIQLISRPWTGDELKAANKGNVPQEFNNGVSIASLSFPVDSSVSWLVAKQEELTAETNALDNFNQNSFGDGQPKTIVVKSSQSGTTKVFKDVSALVKSSDKAGHADFYFVDSNKRQIPGSGISHKAKGASDKSVAERYAGITRLMQNLSKNITSESTVSSKSILLEVDEFASSQGTVDMIKDFVKKASDYYKSQALAGNQLAGFISSIDTDTYREEIETMLYGPEKNDCTMLVISQVDKMSLKKVGKNYELNVGSDGKIFIRPDVPEDPVYKPIFVCRFGPGGSSFYFTKEETKKLKKKKIPSYVKFKNDIAYIPVRLYISPAIRTPSKDAIDISTL